MRIVPTLVCITAMSVCLRDAASQESLSLHAESIRNAITRFALQGAARRAIDKLEQARCRRVLSEFRATSGPTIQAELDRVGDTPRSFVARLTFREGGDRRCRDPVTLAFTSIGGREIFICSPQFGQMYRKDPIYVEALFIHEMMHTLGLGENPPSSSEITARVLKRCA